MDKRKILIELDYDTYRIAEQARIKKEVETKSKINQKDFYANIIKNKYKKVG